MKPDISNWGEEPPLFIQLLAQAVEKSNRKLVAKKIHVSRTAVSQLLSRTYTAGTQNMEVRVLKELGNTECPKLGRISNAQCQKNRKILFPGHNQSRLELWRECQICEHNPASQKAKHS